MMNKIKAIERISPFDWEGMSGGERRQTKEDCKIRAFTSFSHAIKPNATYVVVVKQGWQEGGTRYATKVWYTEISYSEVG